MWAIKNRTPYKTGKSWGRDKEGVHQWLVAVKGTFDIKPGGQLALAESQLEPLLAPEYRGEPGQSSLLYDADLTAPKPTTDVILNGTAYAPQGRPSTDFPIALRVGQIDKTLRVRGNRRWGDGPLGGAPISAQPVAQVPVVYERAYGGYDRSAADPRQHRMDPRNPVGRGVCTERSHRNGQLMANFEYPSGDLESAGPAGFAAIDSFWSPRREFAGTYDAAWQKERSPLLAADWDARSLLCAPADQRCADFLHGGESVDLINLTPSGHLRFALPKVYLTFSTLIDGRTEEHRSRLASVIIEPDYPRVIMVWSTWLACRNDVDYLEETVVREKSYIR